VKNSKGPGKETVPTTSGVASVRDESPRSVRIASSKRGEVNLSLNCSPAVLGSRDFRMPRVEDVCELVEDRWPCSSKKLGSKLSLMNLLKVMCECAWELGSKSVGENKQEGALCLNHRVDENNGNSRSKKKLKPMVLEPHSVNSKSLVVVQKPHVDDVKRLVDPSDVTNGQERRRIPLVCDDDVTIDFPSFHYIRHNVTYQKAWVPISLARVGDEYCCRDCYGDCLKASIPCACARETGGEYAYTSEGLLKENFLDSYISKYRHTQEHHLVYCKKCPLERIKNGDMPGPCKGHLIGTFIKECWTKCGCSRQCGNRVVQRGIRCHLEV